MAAETWRQDGSKVAVVLAKHYDVQDTKNLPQDVAETALFLVENFRLPEQYVSLQYADGITETEHA